MYNFMKIFFFNFHQAPPPGEKTYFLQRVDKVQQLFRYQEKDRIRSNMEGSYGQNYKEKLELGGRERAESNGTGL